MSYNDVVKGKSPLALLDFLFFVLHVAKRRPLCASATPHTLSLSVSQVYLLPRKTPQREPIHGEFHACRCNACDSVVDPLNPLNLVRPSYLYAINDRVALSTPPGDFELQSYAS